MAETLKPCPFCDCRESELQYVIDESTGARCVECINCSARGPVTRTMARAAELWNRRAALALVLASVWLAGQLDSRWLS